MLTFPDIDPVALALGPIEIRWYALAYLAGFLLGWRYVVHLAALDGLASRLTKAVIDDFLPWMILGVILGGRIGYILFYKFEMYMSDPAEILRIWHGGMSFHGGAAGAIVAMVIYAAKHKLPLLKLTDYVCCAVPIGLFFGRVANFVNGELFGRKADVPWAFVFPAGGPEPRHPSQLYEALLEGAVLFIVLVLLARHDNIRMREGFLSGVFLCGYAVARSFVELWREPDTHIGYIAGFLTMGQILCLPMLAGGLFLIVCAFRRKETV